VVAERSGEVVARLAERFCWAKMNAGTRRTKMENKIPGPKNLFVTYPPKTSLQITRVLGA
jgi:hypothetical protein